MASFCPIFFQFLKMHMGEKMIFGVIWRKTGKRKEGEIIPRPGARVEYKGKKYISLRELGRDIDVPYLPPLHKYERAGNIEEAVVWAADVKEKEYKGGSFQTIL